MIETNWIKVYQSQLKNLNFCLFNLVVNLVIYLTSLLLLDENIKPIILLGITDYKTKSTIMATFIVFYFCSGVKLMECC